MAGNPMFDFPNMPESVNADKNDFEIPYYAAGPESQEKIIRDAVDCALKILDDKDWKNAADFLNPWGSIEFTLVHLAAYCGRIDVLEKAVTLYANSSTTGKLRSDGKNADPFLATDKFGRSPLHYAASQGHGNVISWLIGQIGTEYFTHLQLSLRDSSGKTPLHEATVELHSDVVKLLVEYGADVNAPDNEWTRPFLLAHCNVDPNDPDKMSRYENIVDIFTGARADINSANPKAGFTMLHHAVFLESYEVTKKLLDHGADPSCQSLDRWAVTPIHVAAKIGNHGLLCILLKKLTKGLSRTQWPSVIDIPNKDKPSALQVAARYSNFECARTLIDMGANLARRDPYSTTGGTVMDSFCTLTDDLDVADFLKNLLDTKIRHVDRQSGDPLSKHTGSRMLDDHDEMNATLDYKVLAPEGEPQMAVITALIRSLRLPTLRPILTHPLLRAYLAEKWLRVRKVFYTLEMFYFLFVLYISYYALDIGGIHSVWPSVMLILIAYVPFCHKLLQFLAEPRWYFKRFENWLSFIALMISVVVALGGLFVDPVTTSWVSPLLSVAVVFAWFRLTVFLCRMFSWGYYLTLLCVTLKYIGQVLFIAVLLIVGSFTGAFTASKFDKNNTAVISPGINFAVESDSENVEANKFFSFISWIVLSVPLITVYVLGHSLVHLTMCDAREVVKDSKIDRLVKNVEFLADCERITAGWIFRHLWVPKRLAKVTKMTINTSRVVNESVARRYGISTELWKEIYLISVKKTEDNAAAIRLLDEKYNHRTTPTANTF